MVRASLTGFLVQFVLKCRRPINSTLNQRLDLGKAWQRGVLLTKNSLITRNVVRQLFFRGRCVTTLQCEQWRNAAHRIAARPRDLSLHKTLNLGPGIEETCVQYEASDQSDNDADTSNDDWLYHLTRKS